MIEISVTAEFVAAVDAVHLREQARGTVPAEEWPSSFVEQPDGSWVYRVDRDDVDRDAVQAAVDNYTAPPVEPDPDDELDAALADAAAKPTVEEKVDAMLAALRGQAGHDGRVAGRPA